MSVTLNPYGMRPAYSPQYSAAPRQIPNGIASGYGSNIFKYQPVALNASGQLVAASVGADIIGVLAGIRYIDGFGIPHEANFWSAGLTYGGSSGTITNVYAMEAFVWDDPNMVFQIQADGPLAQSIGGQVNFSNIANGSTTVGLSTCTASASSLTTNAQAQLRIVELVPAPAMNGANAWGDAFTEIRVMIARHQYAANKVAV